MCLFVFLNIELNIEKECLFSMFHTQQYQEDCDHKTFSSLTVFFNEAFLNKLVNEIHFYTIIIK